VDAERLEGRTREDATAAFERVEEYIADEYGFSQSRTPVEATLTVSVVSDAVASLTDGACKPVSVGSVSVRLAGDCNARFTTVVVRSGVSDAALTLESILAGLEIASNAAVDTIHIRIEDGQVVQELQRICPAAYDVAHTGGTHFKLCGEFNRQVTAFDFTIEGLSEEMRETAREPADDFIAALPELAEPYTRKTLTDVKERISQRPNADGEIEVGG